MQIINRRRASDPATSARGRRQRGRTRRVCPLLGAAIAAALIAGCGGSSSGGSAPHINSTTTTTSRTRPSTTSTSSTKSSTKPNALAFAKCMRTHGVPSYPDPRTQLPIPSGGISTTASGGSGGINPQSPAYQAASNDCKSLAVATRVTQTVASQVMASQLKFAGCMRANGVPNFPDPTSTGEFGNNGAISGVNPSSPAFQNAEKTCSKFRPLPPGGPSAPSTGG